MSTTEDLVLLLRIQQLALKASDVGPALVNSARKLFLVALGLLSEPLVLLLYHLRLPTERIHLVVNRLEHRAKLVVREVDVQRQQHACALRRLGIPISCASRSISSRAA